MKVKRTNLTDQLMSFEETQTTPSRKTSPPILINYDQIIEKQSQLIESLYKQCTVLRQKINRVKSQELFASDNKLAPEKNMEKFAQMIENSLLKEIANLLEIQQTQISKNKVIQSIKRLRWERQKKSQPIFIQSKKQVRIPVPVQIEKTVEKVVYKQKIVVQQKIVEVPVFRQKIVEKFSKIQELQIMPSTMSILSQEGQKLENSSGIQKSDDSLFLGTDSVLKETVPKQSQKQLGNKNKVIRKNSTKMQQKSQIYCPESKGYKEYENSKKLAMSDVRQGQNNISRRQYYDEEPQKLNSRTGKQNANSQRYSKDNENNCSKYDYNEDEDYNYNRRNNVYERVDKFYLNSNEHNYRNSNEHNHRNSNDHNYPNSNDLNNRTVISPINKQKQRAEGDKYAFDKNRFLDSSKINPNSHKNLKRRDKYDFNENKYRNDR